MNMFLGTFSAICFLIALLVHSLTFVPIDVQSSHPYVWLLHVGCFAVFIPFFFDARREFGKNITIAQLRSALPTWAGILLVCVFGYAIVNFFLFMAHTQGGVPSEIGGSYALKDHGRIVRQLSEPEYHLQRAYVLRGFSGHWLVFYLIPAIYFLCRTPKSASEG